MVVKKWHNAFWYWRVTDPPDELSLFSVSRTKSNQRWMKLRTTVQISSAISAKVTIFLSFWTIFSKKPLNRLVPISDEIVINARGVQEAVEASPAMVPISGTPYILKNRLGSRITAPTIFSGVIYGAVRPKWIFKGYLGGDRLKLVHSAWIRFFGPWFISHKMWRGTS